MNEDQCIGIYNKPPTASSLRDHSKNAFSGRHRAIVVQHLEEMRTERTGLLARQEQNWAWLAENASDPTFVAVMRETHTLASRIDVIDHRISNIEQYQPEMGMDMPTYSIITTPQGK